MTYISQSLSLWSIINDNKNTVILASPLKEKNELAVTVLSWELYAFTLFRVIELGTGVTLSSQLR